MAGVESALPRRCVGCCLKNILVATASFTDIPSSPKTKTKVFPAYIVYHIYVSRSWFVHYLCLIDGCLLLHILTAFPTSWAILSFYCIALNFLSLDCLLILVFLFLYGFLYLFSNLICFSTLLTFTKPSLGQD